MQIFSISQCSDFATEWCTVNSQHHQVEVHSVTSILAYQKSWYRDTKKKYSSQLHIFVQIMEFNFSPTHCNICQTIAFCSSLQGLTYTVVDLHTSSCFKLSWTRSTGKLTFSIPQGHIKAFTAINTHWSLATKSRGCKCGSTIDARKEDSGSNFHVVMYVS